VSEALHVFDIEVAGIDAKIASIVKSIPGARLVECKSNPLLCTTEVVVSKGSRRAQLVVAFEAVNTASGYVRKRLLYFLDQAAENS